MEANDIIETDVGINIPLELLKLAGNLTAKINYSTLRPELKANFSFCLANNLTSAAALIGKVEEPVLTATDCDGVILKGSVQSLLAGGDDLEEITDIPGLNAVKQVSAACAVVTNRKTSWPNTLTVLDYIRKGAGTPIWTDVDRQNPFTVIHPYREDLIAYLTAGLKQPLSKVTFALIFDTWTGLSLPQDVLPWINESTFVNKICPGIAERLGIEPQSVHPLLIGINPALSTDFVNLR